MKTNILKILGTVLFVSAVIFGLVRFDLTPAQAEVNPHLLINSITTSSSFDDQAITSSWKGLREIHNYANEGLSVIDPTELTIANQNLLLKTGWVITNQSGEYQINSHAISLEKGELFYSAEKNTFYLFEGNATIDGVVIEKTELLTGTTVTSLDRHIFTQESFANLMILLRDAQKIPPILTDFVPPELIITSPQDNEKTGEDSITVTGTTEKGATLQVNGAVAVGDNGQFSSTLVRTGDSTSIEVIASDSWANTIQKTITVDYDKCLKIDCTPHYAPTPMSYKTPESSPSSGTSSNSPTPTPVPHSNTTTVRADSSVGCENEMFNYQFLQLLNQYRQSKGLNGLQIEDGLALAACDHAKYMSENGTDAFSHTGANGSSPVERCQNRGTYCDAENLAYSSPDNSPLKMFELYKNSPGHNANMLGEHTVVGIAWAGIFNACDFR